MLVHQIRYWPYGEVRGRFDGGGVSVAASDEFRHEFTGYESEHVSGLQYAGARFYDPELGQFLTHDPERQFASPCAYGPGDPMNGTDPSFAFDVASLAVGAKVLGPVANKAVKFLPPTAQRAVHWASVGYAAFGTAPSAIRGQPFGVLRGSYVLMAGFGLTATPGGGSTEEATSGLASQGETTNPLEIYERPTLLGAGVGTHGVGYIPNQDPNLPGVIVEGRATVAGETWGETFANASGQSGNGPLAGTAAATIRAGTRVDVLAQGYRLVNMSAVPGSFAASSRKGLRLRRRVNSAGVPYNVLPGLFGGANSNTVLYSLPVAIGGPRVSPTWRAVGGNTPFPF